MAQRACMQNLRSHGLQKKGGSFVNLWLGPNFLIFCRHCLQKMSTSRETTLFIVFRALNPLLSAKTPERPQIWICCKSRWVAFYEHKKHHFKYQNMGSTRQVTRVEQTKQHKKKKKKQTNQKILKNLRNKKNKKRRKKKKEEEEEEE